MPIQNNVLDVVQPTPSESTMLSKHNTDVDGNPLNFHGGSPQVATCQETNEEYISCLNKYEYLMICGTAKQSPKQSTDEKKRPTHTVRCAKRDYFHLIRNLNECFLRLPRRFPADYDRTPMQLEKIALMNLCNIAEDLYECLFILEKEPEVFSCLIEPLLIFKDKCKKAYIYNIKPQQLGRPLYIFLEYEAINIVRER